MTPYTNFSQLSLSERVVTQPPQLPPVQASGNQTFTIRSSIPVIPMSERLLRLARPAGIVPSGT